MSFGGSNIDPTAWEDKKCKGESRFPAQVRQYYTSILHLKRVCRSDFETQIEIMYIMHINSIINSRLEFELRKGANHSRRMLLGQYYTIMMAQSFVYNSLCLRYLPTQLLICHFNSSLIAKISFIHNAILIGNIYRSKISCQIKNVIPVQVIQLIYLLNRTGVACITLLCPYIHSPALQLKNQQYRPVPIDLKIDLNL